jgi:hypothetical protein
MALFQLAHQFWFSALEQLIVAVVQQFPRQTEQ